MRRHNSDSFTTGFGSNFPQHDVEIIHAAGTPEERRYPVRAMIQSEAGYFDLDTPIYEGDIVELEDPRGGRRQLHVERVDIRDHRNSPDFAWSSNITAYWGIPRAKSPTTTYHGPVVNINGSHAQVAWDNSGTVNQNSTPQAVTEGYENLARAVADALELISKSANVEPDERELAEETGHAILAEVVETEPNRSAIKRSLATLRGIIAPLAMTAAVTGTEAGVQQLIEQLAI
ncbi:hypothetical protein L612_002000000320 [Rhodococcus rhodochrous J38]|uniref:hypothetical protein n=1 Tax=Rhodococcus rhodochrous TaxID=1829 RepID=UPI0011AA1EDA|nr:hypothetical protein [Rhodococcus rhodochrous]TWH52621.1 hypothetical protein L612_002000000320 [Rhodococcus rhodochrous J38]